MAACDEVCGKDNAPAHRDDADERPYSQDGTSRKSTA